MDSKLIYVAVLLMMLSILILLLLLLEGRKKSKKKNDRNVRVSPPAKVTGAPVQRVPQQMTPQPVEKPGVCHIYADTPRNHVRRCAGCDAENSLSHSRCVVCGCEMGPRGGKGARLT